MKEKDFALSNQLVLNNIEPVELVEADQVQGLTLSEFKKEKDALAARRQQVMLRLDGIKLQQASKVINAMDSLLDRITINIEEGTAMDTKFLVESYDKLSKTLNTICRLDTVDGSGKAARLALQVDFGNGTSVKTMIES